MNRLLGKFCNADFVFFHSLKLINFFRDRQPLTTVAPQKHYRIVFIKAPTEAPATYPTIPLQPPDEEKTLVYVLVKKPDPLPELILPKPATTVPTKPEVYFIRYKTQKEENDGPYPPSNSNHSSNNNYPPNNNNYPPNTSYGPPQNTYTSSSSSSSSTYQTTSPTLGPPLAAYMISSKPLKTIKDNNFSWKQFIRALKKNRRAIIGIIMELS